MWLMKQLMEQWTLKQLMELLEVVYDVAVGCIAI